jgi:hypothetical protein
MIYCIETLSEEKYMDEQGDEYLKILWTILLPEPFP